MSYMRVLRAAEEPVAEIEPVLYEKNHPGPRLRAQITVLQAHPADFDQSFTPSLRSMTRGEDRHTGWAARGQGAILSDDGRRSRLCFGIQRMLTVRRDGVIL